VVIVGVSTIIYTFAGGIKSVVWSDCIQFVVYIGGAMLALAIILQRLPAGWSEFVSFAQSTGKFRIFDGSFDLQRNFTFWSGLFGGAFLALGTHGTDQMMVQRYLCARSERDASLALISSGVVVILQFALFLLLGVALACFYAEVRSTVSFDNTDHVLTTFIVKELPPGWGLIGIILAAIFAAAMSTLSGSLNSSASAALHDFYLPCLRQTPSDRHLLWVSRALTVLFGMIQIGIGIVAQSWATSVVNDVLAIASFSAGLLLGIFALGVFTHRVDQRAALVGLIAGLLVLTWTKFCTPVAYTWYAVIGATTTFVVGVLVSGVLSRDRRVMEVRWYDAATCIGDRFVGGLRPGHRW
jgi:SSS family solute:Na+ symporter